MYIEHNNIQYPCTLFSDGVNIHLMLPDKPELNGIVKLCADDGFELREIDCDGFLRQFYSGETLTLTNEPETTEPTLDELRTSKLNSLDGMCSGAIYNGLDIGTKHYSFTQTAQGNIKGMLIEAQGGKTFFLYAADNEPLSVYTVEQIKEIAQVMGEWINVNTTYYEQLKVWVNRETDTTILGGIQYGAMLPNDLMQEMATKLTTIGVDVSKYAAMLG